MGWANLGRLVSNALSLEAISGPTRHAADWLRLAALGSPAADAHVGRPIHGHTMLTILESRDEIASAQRKFSQSLQGHKPESLAVSIGYQGGHFDTDVNWVASLGIWAYFGFPPEGKSNRSRR
jgi:hypothetical protein